MLGSYFYQKNYVFLWEITAYNNYFDVSRKSYTYGAGLGGIGIICCEYSVPVGIVPR